MIRSDFVQVKMKYVKKIVLFTFVALRVIEHKSPEVRIEQGVLVGKMSDDLDFYEYLGIPYATTNSSTRFQPPRPPQPWDGVFQATEEDGGCPQEFFDILVGNEDCLKINVYVPAVATRPLPVMVYVHGGKFEIGSGGKLLYGPAFLVKHDVILVTFNYRLGALGFLCLGIKEVPGNAGLKDQVAALKWIKQNIAAFGGDPDNVTVFGGSSGAAAVSMLVASETTDELFKKAIVQSGSSISHFAMSRNPIRAAQLFTRAMGYDVKTPGEIYKVLSKVSVEELVMTKVKKPFNIFHEVPMVHLPCVEKEIPGNEPFLSDLPYNLLKRSKKNITIIYGSSNKDGLFIAVVEETEESIKERNEAYLFASDLGFESEEQTAAVNKKVKQFYFGDDPVSMSKLANLSNLYTHMYFEIPELLETNILLENPRNKVYNYNFKYTGYRNIMKFMTGWWNESGASHGDDLFYLFKGRLLPPWIMPSDRQIIDWMTTMWSNFAKTGDPNRPSVLPVKWLPSQREDLKVLYIDNELEMGKIPNQDAYELWKDIYARFRRKTPYY